MRFLVIFNLPCYVIPPLALSYALLHSITCFSHLDASILGLTATNDWCHSTYQDPLLTALPPEHIQMTADKIAVFTDSKSILNGHVTIERDNQFIQTDQAILTINPQNHKITHIDLRGQVKLFEPGKLLAGQKAFLDLIHYTGTLFNAWYRLNLHSAKPEGQTFKTSSIGWGQAQQINLLNKWHYQLQQCSYTTCSPYHLTWYLKSQQMTINKVDHTLQSYHTILYIKGIPIFYMPYLKFNFNQQRQSGFLLPTYGSANHLGIIIGLPYYWNLAPHYDATITPQWYTRRGLMWQLEFRHLQSWGTSEMHLHFLPFDRHFDPAQVHHTLWHHHRGSLQLKQRGHWGAYGSWHIDYHKVSDDNYLKDFGSPIDYNAIHQLRQQWTIRYEHPHIQMYLGLQGFQTVQPSQVATAKPVYQRLPFIQLASQHYYGSFQFSLNTHYNHFVWPGQRHSVPWTILDRVYLEPKCTWSMQHALGFLRPSIALSSTHYRLYRSSHISGQAHHSRVLPIIKVDHGFYLPTRLFSAKVILEPRLTYLHIPFRSQDHLPIIDTSYAQPTYEQLFQTNRFLGYDRLGDTHHISYGLSGRLWNPLTAMERCQFGIGQSVYRQKRQVSLGPLAEEDQYVGFTHPAERFSPLTGFLNFNLAPQIRMRSDFSYQWRTKKTTYAHISLQYAPANRPYAYFNYGFIRNGDTLTPRPSASSPQHMHQLSAASIIPWTERWRSYTGLSYNINLRYVRHYFIGLEYNSCCWAGRVLVSRVFREINTMQKPLFNHMLYVQIALKGLGSYQKNELRHWLNDQCPHYHDQF